MGIDKKPLILASGSASRAKILSDFGIDFKQICLDCNEDEIQTKSPKSFAYSAARLKYDHAIRLLMMRRIHIMAIALLLLIL